MRPRAYALGYFMTPLRGCKQRGVIPTTIDEDGLTEGIFRPAFAGGGFNGGPDGGNEGGGELFVQGEEVLDAVAVALEGLGAVTAAHGAVERGMGLGENGRHGQRIVKIGEGGIGKLLAGVQNGLRGGFDGEPDAQRTANVNALRLAIPP